MPVRNKSKPSARFSATPQSILLELESEAIYVLRQAAASFERSAILFSGGKDSAVVLHLARKAFFPATIPFQILHVDTGHNFPEVLTFRDTLMKHLGLDLQIYKVQDSIDKGTVQISDPVSGSRNAAQAVTLKEAILNLKLNCCIGGARRDEEKARAKERFFSVRNDQGGWDPLQQRPEIGELYNSYLTNGQQMRVFPISNWTELDVWSYISQENIDLPPIYFSHPRKVVRQDSFLLPVTDLTPAQISDTVETLNVRFRTVGDILCTSPVLSNATNPQENILELSGSVISERGATRRDDHSSRFSMEKRKRDGYF